MIHWHKAFKFCKHSDHTSNTCPNTFLFGFLGPQETCKDCNAEPCTIHNSQIHRLRALCIHNLSSRCSGQLHAPATFLLVKRVPSTQLTSDWVRSADVLNDMAKRKILPLSAIKSQHLMIIKTVNFLKFKIVRTSHKTTHADS